ncbi:MAG: hypothetical protein Phyf2KO_00030 [Phycisphaerales bacterium]
MFNVRFLCPVRVAAFAVAASVLGGASNAQINEELCVFSDRLSIDGEAVPIVLIERDGLLFYTTFSGELVILDISDPENIARLGSALLTPHPIFGRPAPLCIALDGDYFYAISDEPGIEVIEVFDISDPTSPTSVSVTPYSGSTSSNPWNAIVAGNTLYFAGVDSLHAIDISQPTAPTDLGATPLPLAVNYPELQVVGDHLYGAGNELVIFDISNPQTPTLEATVATPGATFGCLAHENGLYVASRTEGLLLYDLETPTNPSLESTLSLPGGARYIDVQSSMLSVTSDEEVIYTIDISEPISPEIVRTTKTVHHPWRVAVNGEYAYTSHFDVTRGLIAFRVAGEAPAQPVLYETQAPGVLLDFALQDKLAFRATDSEGVQIYDISDPEAMQLVSTYGATFDYIAVGVYNDLMFTSENNYGLRVVDISDPANPARLSPLSGEFVTGIRVNSEGNVYVSVFSDRVYELDYSDPANPALIDYPNPNIRADLFTMDDTTAFIVEDRRAFEILVLDLTIPNAPVELGQIEAFSGLGSPQGDVTDIEVSGDNAYLADEEGQLWVVDISDLTAEIVDVRPIPIHESFRQIAIDGDVMVLSGEGMPTRLYNLDQDGTPIWLGSFEAGSQIIQPAIVGELILGASNSGIVALDLDANCDPDCLPDVNNDGMLTPTDFTAWINAFNDNLPECDQNGDNACTPTDFTAWIANYNLGC